MKIRFSALQRYEIINSKIVSVEKKGFLLCSGKKNIFILQYLKIDVYCIWIFKRGKIVFSINIFFASLVFL